MYRILYDLTTGKIYSCRKISDAMLDKNVHPGMGYINGFVVDINKKQVNVSTLEIEDKVIEYDWLEYMRTKRTQLLKACDWTQGADSPLSEAKKTEWATYRQALRDMPISNPNPTSADNITWPASPE